jgi:hypothetical protein
MSLAGLCAVRSLPGRVGWLGPGGSAANPSLEVSNDGFRQPTSRGGRHLQVIDLTHGPYQQALIGPTRNEGWPRVATADQCVAAINPQPVINFRCAMTAKALRGQNWADPRLEKRFTVIRGFAVGGRLKNERSPDQSDRQEQPKTVAHAECGLDG